MPFNKKFVNVIGSGFAGMECALFLASHGVNVHLFDCGKTYENDNLDEEQENKDRELLRRELQFLGSAMIGFEKDENGCYRSQKEMLALGKQLLSEHVNINIHNACIYQLNPDEITILATGAYTDDRMVDYLVKTIGTIACNRQLFINPILNGVDTSKLVKTGENEFALPLSYQEYLDYINAVIDEINLMPEDFQLNERSLERLVSTDKDALKNYSLARTLGQGEYADFHLQECEKGFEVKKIATKFDRDSQTRIFQKVEAFKNASLARSSKIVNCCQISSPYALTRLHSSQAQQNLFFSGSILGIGGYLDCIASGLYSGLCVLKYFDEKPMPNLPASTAIGALAEAIISPKRKVGQRVEEFKLIPLSDGENSIERLEYRSKNVLSKFKEEYLNGKHV